jgi:hypothetical protein
MTDALIETDEPGPAADGGGGGPEPPGTELGRPANPLKQLWGVLEGWLARWGAMPASGWVTLAVVTLCVLGVLFVMGPLKLISDTTPTGGDMSAHVWGPAYLRDHLLPKGRLTGWSPDWYAGFPAFEFYMVPPFLAIALLSYVVPYGVAFKLVAVSGAVSLPIVCWAFGRLNRLPFPAPAFMAIAAMFFLLDRSYAIYGGNIASTLAGEFSFAISLSLAILYLGVLGYALRTGKHLGWAALLFALAALCHVIPALFAVVGTIVWVALRPSWRSVVYGASVGFVGVVLAAWWYIPFVGRSSYLNDMGWTKLTDWGLLYSRDLSDSTNRNYPDLRTMVILAIVGLVVSLLTRHRAGVYLGALAISSGLAFRYLPESRLWNARVLPFYYLSVYLLAFVGVALIVVTLARWFAADDRPLERAMHFGAVALVVLFAFVYLGMPMQAVPGGHMSADGSSYELSFGPVQYSSETSYLASWADWNFNGLEAWGDKPEKDASGQETGTDVATYDRSYPEFHDLIKTLQDVAAEHGCGRAMWEYEENHDRYGSTMEPMMLPHFTDGCIGSMEGLYFEASATTPYHFINSTQLSRQGSAPQKELPYAQMPNPNQADFDQGVGHLQMLGVKYYMAIDESMKQRAAANPDLRKVADSGPWSIYTVAGSELVAPIANEPVVLTGPKGVHDWLDTSACWYVNEALWGTPLVADGPDSWQRVGRTVPPNKNESAQQRCYAPAEDQWGWLTKQGPESRPLPPVKVSNIQSDDDSISFDVDRVGVPVMVRTSFFPNWNVTGAEGPHRSTPNLMVVVPTSNHVELEYGTTSLEMFAYGVSLAGVFLLALLFVLGPFPAPRVTRFWAATELPDPPVVDPPPPEPGTEWAAGQPASGNGPPPSFEPSPGGRAPDPGREADAPDPSDAPDASDDPPAPASGADGDAPGGLAPIE